MKRVQVLLVLSTSLRAAFPDRADALLEEIEGWFPLESKGSVVDLFVCALCGTGRPPHARCFLHTPPASRFCVYGSRPRSTEGPSIALCSSCIDRVLDAEGSHLRVLTDAVRALRSPDPDANDDAVRRLEEIHARWVPTARREVCAICAGPGPSVSPDATVVCSACVATAHHVLHTASPQEWSRLARDLEQSDNIDAAMEVFDHLRAIGEPTVEAIDAVARRMAHALGIIAGSGANTQQGGDIHTDVHAPRRVNELLTRYHPSETARREMLASIMRLADRLDAGTRFFRQEAGVHEDITEEFEVVSRFAIPRSAALWAASASGVVAIYGGPLTSEQAARRITCWGGRPDILSVGTRGGTARMQSVPDGATLWIGDWSSLVPDDRARLLARRGAWRVFVGARDRDDLPPDLLRIIVDEHRLAD